MSITPRKAFILGAFVVIAATAALGLSTPLGGGHTFQVTCATTATRIADPTSTGISSFLAWNNSATAAFIGGSDVNATTLGLPICTTNSCFSSSFSIDGGGMYCMSVGGAVVLTVVAGK